MKRMILVALLCAASGAFAQKTDFSGNYRVNEEKVNWGPAPKYILPRFIKASQLKDRIIISRTALNGQMIEQTPAVDTILFDGTVFEKKKADGGKTTSSLKWTDDRSFVLVRKSVGTDGKVSSTTTETWSLEDGGKTLFVNRDVDGKMKFNTKAYFDKQ